MRVPKPPDVATLIAQVRRDIAGLRKEAAYQDAEEEDDGPDDGPRGGDWLRAIADREEQLLAECDRLGRLLDEVPPS